MTYHECGQWAMLRLGLNQRQAEKLIRKMDEMNPQRADILKKMVVAEGMEEFVTRVAMDGVMEVLCWKN